MLDCKCLSVRASDKRIACEEEFSDSEDEGEGSRRHQESMKIKRVKLEERAGKDTGVGVFFARVWTDSFFLML